ncbi:hypothetical protein Plhal304r1_c066g0154341 [Plasmopara halstedii]
MNKFYTYLKEFSNSKPKSFFPTPIYDSMTIAINESNVNYVNDLKDPGLNELYTPKRKANFALG